jgi:DNA-binding Lrp family transcriptional regulator
MTEQTTALATGFPRADFVERMGVLWEAEQLPRIAGRIFGHLLTEPDPCSLDEMAAALGVSKASVSTDARRLEQIGLIERVGLPGDRRDYYAVAADVPARVLALKLGGMRRHEVAFDEFRDRAALHPDVRARLERFERMHRRIVDAMQVVLDELTAAGAGDPSHDLTSIRP